MPFSCFLFHPRKSCEKHRKCSHTNVSNASVIRFSTPLAQTATFVFTSESGYTLGFRRKIAHSGSQGEAGRFGWGWYHYPRTVSHVSETLRGQGAERRTLPLLGLGRVCSRRTQKAFGTAMRVMRVAVPRRRGPAGLRDLFYFCRNCGLYALRSGLSACMGQGWYHYPRSVSHGSETLRGRGLK